MEDVNDVKLEWVVPKTILSATGSSPSELASDISRRAAASLYADGVLSLGKAAELAGISLADFLDYLRSRKIPLSYSAEDLRQDVLVLKEMRDGGK